MRMRKLGKGQTVVFCVPEEIRLKIEERTSKGPHTSIDISDVLCWAIWETCTEIRWSMPLWEVQGKRFARQRDIRNGTNGGEPCTLKAQAEALLEDEAQSIEERYRPRRADATPHHLASSDEYLGRIAERCREFEDLQFHSSSLSEEQERELAPEIEEERQVQRATPAEPAGHHLHADVIRFISDGVLVAESVGYVPAFHALLDTSAAISFNASQLTAGGHLLASADFVRTVKKDRVSFLSDGYQRSVQWILTSDTKSSDTVACMMIISPHEAQELMTRVRRSTKVTLHLYKPRLNLGYRSFDCLDFFSIPMQRTSPHVPRSLAIQLNLFAGQLYLSSFDDYRKVCNFLGLAAEEAPAGWIVAPDGFILHDDAERVGGGSGLTSSPVLFLNLLMTKIRRNGEAITKTHMGSILDGRLLSQSDFAS